MTRSIAAAALLLAGLLAGAAQAAVYKCKTPSGAVTFTDAPCATYPAAKPADAAAATDTETPAGPPASAYEPATPPAEEPTEAVPAAESEPAPSNPPESSPPPAAEPAPAAPLKRRESRSGNWVFVGLGALLALVGYVVQVVVAFRAGQTGWGVALLLLSPLSTVVYSLLHFRRAVAGLVLTGLGYAIVFAAYVPSAKLIDVSDSYLTARNTYDVADRRPRTTFTLDQQVNLKTVLAWDDWSVETLHFVGWIWYTDGVPVGRHLAPVPLNDESYVLLGYMPASTLGEGAHHVELYLDGELFDSRPFRVVR